MQKAAPDKGRLLRVERLALRSNAAVKGRLSPLHIPQCYLDAGCEVELGEDVGDVGRRRVDADHELLGDSQVIGAALGCRPADTVAGESFTLLEYTFPPDCMGLAPHWPSERLVKPHRIALMAQPKSWARSWMA